MIDAKALREALGKATKRPWEVSVLSNVPRDDSIGIIGPDGADVVTHGGLWPSITDDADAALIVTAVNALSDLLDATEHPIAIVLTCPLCKQQHVDEGEWETRVHRTHQCVAGPFGVGCGHQWRPSNRATRGVTYDYLRDESKVQAV